MTEEEVDQKLKILLDELSYEEIKHRLKTDREIEDLLCRGASSKNEVIYRKVWSVLNKVANETLVEYEKLKEN